MKASAFPRIHPVTLIRKLTPGMEDRGNLILTLQHLAHVAQQVFGADFCAIEMFHPFTREQIHSFVALSQGEDFSWQSLSQELLTSINAQDLILVSRLEDYPEYQNTFTKAWEIQSFAAFALCIRPDVRPVGVLYLAFRKQRYFRPGDYDQVQFFAGQATFVLQDTWLLHCYREVARIGQDINQDFSTPEVLFRKLYPLVTDILDANHVLLLALPRASMDTQDIHLIDEGSYCYLTDIQLSGACRHVLDTMDSILIHHWSEQAAYSSFQIVSIEGTKPNESYIFVPMILHDIPLGVLSIQHPQPNAYTEEDRALLQMLANQMALAMKNMRAFESVSKRHTRELEMVQEIDQEISRSLELEPILETLLQRAAECVSAESGSILLADTRRQILEARAVLGAYADRRATLKQDWNRPEGVTGWVFHHQQRVRVANVHTCEPWCSLYLEMSPLTVSELAIPLINGTKAVGVLNLESSKEGAFSKEDEVFLQTLAAQAVLAITRAQNYEHEKRLAEEQRVMNDISREIASQLDPGSVFTQILAQALDLTKSQNGVLMLYDREKNILWMAAEHGVRPAKRGASHRLDEGVVGYVARTKRIYNVDPSQSPWNEYYLDYIHNTRSELAVPICAGDTLLGVLNMESELEHAFDENDERLLLGLSNLVAVALRYADLYKKAEQEALSSRLLYQTGRDLSEISEWKQLEQGYEVIVRLAHQQGHSHVVLRRYEEATGDLVLERSACTRQVELVPRIKVDEGVNGYVTRQRCTCIVDDLSNPALLPPGVDAPVLNDPMLHSLLVIPVQFKDRYYGTLGLLHEAIGYFQQINVQFYEGLAQQLASTIYRLEAVQARLAAEELSLIGESAMELTHFLANQLGLVESYVGYVSRKLAEHMVKDRAIEDRLENITTAVRRVLQWSRELKERLRNPRETDIGLPVSISPETLFWNVWNACPRPEDIDLHMDISPEIENVCVFERLVAYILQNLIKNALEAMENGGVLTLRAYNTGNSVAMEVEDTGGGIPREQIEHIFDLFHSTKESSGYGLWSARRNAIRVHGDLRVKSTPGHGTIFILLLPRGQTHGER